MAKKKCLRCTMMFDGNSKQRYCLYCTEERAKPISDLQKQLKHEAVLARRRERYRENIEHFRAQNREYYKNRPELQERVRERVKLWRFNNPEHAAELGRSWRARNPELYKAEIKRTNERYRLRRQLQQPQ